MQDSRQASCLPGILQQSKQTTRGDAPMGPTHYQHHCHYHKPPPTNILPCSQVQEVLGHRFTTTEKQKICCFAKAEATLLIIVVHPIMLGPALNPS